MAPQCALIADIVGSRALSDRPSAQRALEAVLARAAQGLDLLQEPVATIGDEFQLATRTLADALVYTARVHLLVPDGLSLRFGIGEGQILVLDALGADEHGHYLQDGSAWWAARAAIDRAHARQDGASPFQRTWYASDPEGAPADAVVNALLTLRDHAVWRLSARQRRIAGALAMGEPQVAIARAEKISQQAVSDFARGAGAGVFQPTALIHEGNRA